MSLQIQQRNAGDVLILDLAGRITLGEGTERLREAVRGMATSRKNILLNLAGVEHLDSGGLGELVGSYSSVSAKGGTVKLLNPQKRITSLLLVTKLLSVFETFEDERVAIASFTPVQV